MVGILKNKQEKDQTDVDITSSTKAFREQVLKNTKLNALLKTQPDIEKLNSNGAEPHATTGDNATSQGPTTEEKLQWNKQNLSENEIIQKNIIENLEQTIDEPKTPFQKATQPELNEYYQDSEDEEHLEDFSLGEPELKLDDLEGLGKVQKPKEITNQDDGRKKSFEEMRKEHYHNEHLPTENPLSHRVDNDADDEGEDEEEEEEEPKPKKSFAELRKQHYHHEVPATLGHTLDVDDEEEEDNDE